MQSWLAFYKTLKPDLILSEHSPTAMLAARVAGLPCAVVGTGFTLPKAQEPFASITPWVEVSDELLQASTDKALERCNQVLESCGGEPLARLSDLMEARFKGLVTFAELDHYGPREGVDYYGLFMSRRPKPRPLWPPGDGPRIFVYQHHASASFQV